MFRNTKAFSSYSVNDLEKAKDFYTNILDVEVKETPEGLELHVADGIPVFLYPKPNHEPATFTVLNFLVDDIDSAVEALSNKGVTFEHYDFAEMKTDEKGIARQGERGIAWFKDPAGNFISIIQEK